MTQHIAKEDLGQDDHDHQPKAGRPKPAAKRKQRGIHRAQAVCKAQEHSQMTSSLSSRRTAEMPCARAGQALTNRPICPFAKTKGAPP